MSVSVCTRVVEEVSGRIPNWSYERRMPMYSFSSRSRTSTFSVVVSTMCRS